VCPRICTKLQATGRALSAVFLCPWVCLQACYL